MPTDYHLLVDGGPQGPHVGCRWTRPCIFAPLHRRAVFESAADHYGPRLVGILLSGANEDGVNGLQAIQAAGGLTIVQEPASASMPTMPQAAIAALAVDHILPPEGIASAAGRPAPAPAALDPGACVPFENPIHPPPPPMPQTDRTKCLLVDDVEENPIAPEALLQRDGLDILKAQSGPRPWNCCWPTTMWPWPCWTQMPEMNG